MGCTGGKEAESNGAGDKGEGQVPALVPSKSIAQHLGVVKAPVPLKKLTIILVGSGGVGKSTLFKQLKVIYGEGFDAAERRNALTHLLKYVLHSMRIVLKMGLDKALVELTSAIEINYEKLDSITFEEISPDKADLLATIKGAMVELWAIPEVKELFKNTSSDIVKLSWAVFFFEKLDQLYSPGYSVTEEDMLRLRRQTEGSMEFTFKTDTLELRVVDLGGQAHEQKHWSAFFQECFAVIYMISLTDYSLTLDDKTKTNKLVSSIHTLEDLYAVLELRAKPFIILLNKYDLFADCLSKTKFSTVMQAAGPGSGGIFNGWDDNTDHIIENVVLLLNSLRKLQNKTTDKFENYYYTTCATDTSMIEGIFTSILDQIKKESLNVSFNL